MQQKPIKIKVNKNKKDEMIENSDEHDMDGDYDDEEDNSGQNNEMDYSDVE